MQDSPLKSTPDEHSDATFDHYDAAKIRNGLQRHLLLITLSTLFFTLLAAKTSYNFLTTYKAEAIVIFQADNNPKTVLSGLTVTDFTLATAMDIIKLPANLQAVKSILGLKETQKEISAMYDIPVPRSESNLIRVIALNSDPEMAINLANTLAEVAVRNSQTFSSMEVQGALQNYQRQLDLTKNRLATQLKEIEDFKNAHQYFDMTAENLTLLREIAEVKRNLLSAQVNYNGLLVEYEKMKNELDKLPPNARTLGTSSYQIRIAALESAISEAKSKYAEKNPKLIQLQDELYELRSKKYMEENEPADPNNPQAGSQDKENIDIEMIRMQARVSAADTRQKELKDKLVKLESHLKDLPAHQVQFSKLLQQRALTEQQITRLSSSIESLQLMVNSPKGSLQFYQKAIEAKPSRDSILVYLLPLAGLFFGFGTGLAGAFFMEMYDNKIRTAKEVKIHFNLPCWAVIPELPKLQPKHGEARMRFFVRQLDEKLEHLQRNKKGFSIAISSTQEYEGKTCLTAQMAKYSAERGRKTMVLYMDPRSSPFYPEYHKKGLADYLRGKVPAEEIIQEGPYDCIRLLYEDSDMKELVKSTNMVELWLYLCRQYDWIYIETPGIIADDYAINLTQMCLATIFVIGSSQTNIHLVEGALKQLSEAGVIPLCVILNRVLPVYIDDEHILRQLKRRWHDAK